jgi:hypothetical protein
MINENGTSGIWANQEEAMAMHPTEFIQQNTDRAVEAADVSLN